MQRNNEVTIGLILGALLLAVLIAVATWRLREARKAAAGAAPREVPPAPLPDGATLLLVPAVRPSGEEVVLESGIMFVFCGSIGTIGADILRRIALTGEGRRIGSIVVLEFDAENNAAILASIPEEFRPRVVPILCGSLPSGLDNQSIAEVKQLMVHWGDAILEGARRAEENHMRWNQVLPSPILVFPSTGGHALPGAYLVEHLKVRFPNTQIYGFGVLPEDTVNRAQVLEILDLYRSASMRGIMLADNANGNSELNDQGFATLLSAWITGRSLENRIPALNNVLFKLTAPMARETEVTTLRLVSFSAVAYKLPARTLRSLPGLPPRYFVMRDLVKSEILSAWRKARRSAAGGPDHVLLQRELPGFGGVDYSRPRYDIVVANLDPDGFQAVRDAIFSGLELLYQGISRRDEHFLFVPQPLPVDPEDPSCQLIVISVRALTDEDKVLAFLTDPTGPTPSPNGHGAPTGPTPSANGHGAPADAADTVVSGASPNGTH